MPTQEEIDHQFELLKTYRRNLRHLERQAALYGGEVWVPIYLANSIWETRGIIQRIKGVLRGWGLVVDDLSYEQVAEEVDHHGKFNEEHLYPDYISPSPVFDRVNLDQFTGREWLANRVDSFLRSHRRGYFILEAEAGLGKTTFMAWLAQRPGYIHHFAELAPGPSGVEAGIKSLAAQIMMIYGVSLQEGAPPNVAHHDYLFRLLEQAAQSHVGEQIVLVVDALDEAGALTDQNVLGLPQTLPVGVFIIVSQRPVSVKLDIDVRPAHFEHFVLTADSDNNQADTRRFLEQAITWPGIAYALRESKYTPAQFMAILLEKCRGVWMYLYHITQDIEQRQRLPQDLDALPDGLTGYYIRYWMGWRDRDEKQWDEIYLPALGTLAAARDPITIKELLTWAGVEELLTQAGVTNPTQLVRRLLREKWRPFLKVTGSGQQKRYQFYHATLREFFEGRVIWDDLPNREQAFVEELQQATIDALRRGIQNAPTESLRRDTAFRLIDMDWMDNIEDVSAEELLNQLDLIAPYLTSPSQRHYLIQSISHVLASTLSDRLRAQLLVYRAAIKGDLKDIDASEQDYTDSRCIIRKLIRSTDSYLEDRKALARALLGSANIIQLRIEKLDDLEDRDRTRRLLQRRAKLYLLAAKLAKSCKNDAFLEANIYNELSDTYSLLHDWGNAEKYHYSALETLKQARDRETYASYYATILDTASNIRWRKAQSMLSSHDNVQALHEYEIACDLTLKEIDLLEQSFGASESLAIAHFNLGDYLLAKYEIACDLTLKEIDLLKQSFGASESLAITHLNLGDYLLTMSEHPDHRIPQLKAQACDQWCIALQMASRLIISEVVQAARQRLDQHCQNTTSC